MTMKHAIPPQGDARDDFAIFADLAERLGRTRRSRGARRAATAAPSGRVPRAAQRRRARFRVASWNRHRGSAGRADHVLLTELHADPETIASTPSGRIELDSERIAGSAMTTARRIRPDRTRGVRLGRARPRISRSISSSQPRYKLHTQMDQRRPGRSARSGREAIAIHPDDARPAIGDGDARVFNDRRGAMPARSFRRGNAGVVRLSFGAGYDPEHDGEAASRPGNANSAHPRQGHLASWSGPTSATALVEIRSARMTHRRSGRLRRRPSPDRMLRVLEPVEYEFGNGVAVLPQHQHVAIADNAAVTEIQESAGASRRAM